MGNLSTCNTSPVAFKDAHYSVCTADNDLLKLALPGKVISGGFQISNGNKSLFANIYINHAVLFSCLGWKCKQTYSTGTFYHQLD